MNRSSRIKVLTAAGVALVLAAVGAWGVGLPSALRLRAQAAEHAAHEDHDGEPAETHAAGEAHEAGEADGHDDHEQELGPVKLTAEQMRKFGVELATAGPGELRERLRLPGEIALNADGVVHVVPPAGGIVRKVMVKTGDTVRAGEVMAVLESAELAEAKTQYLAKLNELSCCGIDLTRAEVLEAGTRKLLELLAKSPSLDELRALDLPDVGEGHSKLVAAYAELVFAQAVYEREKKLLEKDISSRADFQTAETACKKALAEYVATRGSLAFQTRRDLLESRRSQQSNEMEVRAAGQRLHLLGLSTEDVECLRGALTGGGQAGGHDCDDPNCPTCKSAQATGEKARHHEADEGLGVYSLRAPLAGTVIEKHITLGEKLAGEAEVFTLADLGTVWVNLSVYQKDLLSVRPGQAARIVVGSGVPDAVGKIAYVSPTVDGPTRTCQARVVLANPDGRLRPGLFVTADLETGQARVAVLVPGEAVQQIEDERVVFVSGAEGLVPRPVKLGRRSGTGVEIVSGLSAGERYVAKGAFELKAKIVTSGLGAHAGHGH